MIRAVFVDYTGTIITQGGRDAEELVYRVCKNSDMKDPSAFLKYWWGMVKEYEESFDDSAYITEDEVVHIGDSITSDANGAKAVGIQPILLDRDGKYGMLDVPVAKSCRMIAVLE